MIRATLHGKLPGELLAKEDALTATVFERLAYLEPERAWRILLAALRPIGTAPTPAATFQPSLWPWFTLEDGRRVQPDVLLPTGDRLLVIEAKRPEAGESQHEAQWGRELRAVRLRHAGPLMLVVLAPPTDAVARIRRFLEDFPGVSGATLGWEDLAACSQPDGYLPTDGDCDDADPAVNPDAIEICDGVDDDCDGTVDGSDATDAPTWYTDADGDGYGDAATGSVQCDPDGTDVSDGSDCDDGDAGVHPGAPDGEDGRDNDCDGPVDEDTWIGTGADGALQVSSDTDLSTSDVPPPTS